MRRIRQLKKSQNLIRSVQSQSRTIISSIYETAPDNDQLQFSQAQEMWNISPQNQKNTFEKPTIITQQPLKHLLPLMNHLIKQPQINICSFILFDYNNIHTITQEQQIRVTKDKKEKNKLRYWLSHIYFQKLRNKLTEQLINSANKAGQERDVIHANEDKQYMPMSFSAKKQASMFVRKFKVSPQAMYSKQGQAERQPFCIGYFLNGAQQLFSFTEILSFIQYPFNLSQVSYLKIIPFQKDGTPYLRLFYSKETEKNEEKSRKDALKRILKRQDRWRYEKEQIDEIKNTIILNKQFEAYAKILLLELIVSIEINEHIQIKQLNVEWIIDSEGNYHLSNCFKYIFNSINTFANTDGLVTLYEKRMMERSLMFQQAETEKTFRIKKMRSEQKSLAQRSSKVAHLNWRDTPKYSQVMSQTIPSGRRKVKSSIKNKPNKRWVA